MFDADFSNDRIKGLLTRRGYSDKLTIEIGDPVSMSDLRTRTSSIVTSVNRTEAPVLADSTTPENRGFGLRFKLGFGKD